MLLWKKNQHEQEAKASMKICHMREISHVQICMWFVMIPYKFGCWKNISSQISLLINLTC